MKKLLQIVCNREWSERLKESGYPQQGGLFFWVNGQVTDGWEVKDDYFPDTDKWVAAPTGTELVKSIMVGAAIPGSVWFDCDVLARQVVWMLAQKIITPEDIRRVLK